MTRDDIYDHLAQVYLGKRKEADDKKKKKQFNAWLVINGLITLIIFASAFYGLTAFLTHKKPHLQSNVIYSLHNGPVRMRFDFEQPFPPVKSFALDVSGIDASKYVHLHFSVRAKEEGSPGIMKIVLKNSRNEVASYYVEDVDYRWQELSIPLEEFQNITDLSTLTDVSFVLESWNVEKKSGVILIDDIFFSS